jgi:hypothetical protein
MRIRWREFELPNRVVRDESSSNDRYGMFVAEPFERGFGTTVGNGLRRVLLSSLEGAAVTHVKIAGVQHEFSIEGVVEDMTELVLNVKRSLVKVTAPDPRRSCSRSAAGPSRRLHRANEFRGQQGPLTLHDRQGRRRLRVRGDRPPRPRLRHGRENADGTWSRRRPVDSILRPSRVRCSTAATRVGR